VPGTSHVPPRRPPARQTRVPPSGACARTRAAGHCPPAQALLLGSMAQLQNINVEKLKKVMSILKPKNIS